ncbi:cyclopropane fatty acyl phospholipid synthase [Burkholderia multivorans]|nr:cyclopropane fatty acyl phospholipid synthase [Burkholderia multivorans]
MKFTRSDTAFPTGNKERRTSAHILVEGLLELADVKLNGARPWDIQLRTSGVPEAILAYGNLGLGESYMDGRWECDQLDELFSRVLMARLDEKVRMSNLVLHTLRSRWTNRQTTRRAWQVGKAHYDLGNEFYQAMLDERMTYTCGYWGDGALTLSEAQEHKLDLICRKLELRPGMRLLDIGCGWGSLMGYASERYGVSCVGVTISKEQAEFGANLYANHPIEFRLMDYRDLNETFDRIASIGMFEHVGSRNYRTYMDVARRCLTDDGLFLLHTIGKNRRGTPPDPWIDRYIFPNGEIPALSHVTEAIEGRFVVEDLHNFGADYDRTLTAWYRNFEAAWPRFADSMGERFRRMWRYYLLSCAGGFRAREIQLWQWVLSKRGILGGYRRP